MKRLLLGTTALVAAGVIGAGEARAEFDATVNGNYYVGWGFVNQDDDTGQPGNRLQNQAINDDFEVHFRISQTTDNGLTFGGRVELEGQTSAGDQIDENWIFVRGGFGEIRVGDEDDARKLKSYTAPSASAFMFGVNSPYFTFNAGTGSGVVVSSNSTVPNIENDSSKIIYFTPSFGGFQLAVSYAPDATQDRGGFGTGGTQDTISNATSIGADWSGELGGVTIGAGGGYSWAQAETNTLAPAGGPVDDPSIWAAGVNIGFGGFTVGGSIAVGDDTGVLGFNGYSVSEATVFDVGVTYNVDAVTVGVAWSHGEYDVTAVGGTQTDEVDFVNGEIGYALAEGVLLGAFIGWFDFESDTPARENTGWQAGAGLGFDF